MSEILRPIGIAWCCSLLLLSSARFADTSFVVPAPQSIGHSGPATDTVPPLKERYGSFLTDPPSSPFDLDDPAAIEKNVEYDPESGQYIITEKIGDDYFRPPTYMTFDEYMEFMREKEERDYFNRLAGIATDENASATDPLARVDVKSNLLDRLFGGRTIEIDPRGTIDLTFGVDLSRVENPILTERQRRTGGFNFDMNIQMNVTGKIGQKLNLTANYNTNATFNFDNQIKIDYNSDLFSEDEIIKKIEAGNVSFPLRGSLIQGTQSLFGFKTELQFGRLRLTGLISQQRSQRNNIQIQGGSQLQTFEVKADEYDENRHFFFSFYNRGVYEEALQNMPQINTLFRIENIQVWVTNDRNATENVRDIVALADLGEPDSLVNPDAITSTPQDFDITGTRALPDNDANDLYLRIKNTPGSNKIDQAVATLKNQFGLVQTRDFEKVSARQLDPSEYTFHPELGYLSLNINLQPNQVLGVAFEYSYNGETYFVGDLANNIQNVSTDSLDPVPEVLFVKMLKSTIQRTDVPTWDLMMKNVYAIGAFQVNQQDFFLDVYYEDPGEGEKRFLPESQMSSQFGGFPWLRLLNLDRLNVQGDPVPDGVFDYVPGVTINPRNGRIIFPVLEPFGTSLADRLEDDIEEPYIYQELYDSTLFLAREFQEKNRYTIRGEYKSSVSSEISLGAFNIPRGSVTVTAGGQILREGIDYEVDYNIGRVRILNDALLSSGAPINVSFEDNTLFGFQNRTMLGLRADYQLDDDFNIGATYLHLYERPFTQKVNIGDDPINNRIYGLDINFSRKAPWLTKAVDALPGLSTKAPSSITVSAEGAFLKPGHSRAINQNRDSRGGLVYIDDFEGSTNGFDLRQPANRWVLASVPQRGPNDPLPNYWPEGDLINDIRSGANRAHLNWYRIDQIARRNDASAGVNDDVNPYTSQVPLEEVFPNVTLTPAQLPNIQTFDLTYYPSARGQYNFDVPGGYPDIGTAGISFIGDSVILNQPRTRWAGIMREMPTIDFQSANIEYLEFWMLSPFLSPEDPFQPHPEREGINGGTLTIHFGNISEDILRDSRMFFENGLPGPTNPDRRIDSTEWGVVPVTQRVINAFDNDPDSRDQQDLGFDGLDNQAERENYVEYLDAVRQANPNAAARLERDPSQDDYAYYADDAVFGDSDGVLRRYYRFNNTQGNSPVQQGGVRSFAYTNFPDAEDIDNDNTVNETEAFFEYEIPFFYSPVPGEERFIDENRTPFITDRREAPDGRVWYRFRVPINTSQRRSIGGIRDTRSIRFMRMLMRNFEQQTTFRFATLELIRNQWREYRQGISNVESTDCDAQAQEFVIDAVGIEQNSSKEPFNYVLPLDIQREQSLGVFNALQNEQSLLLRTTCLADSADVSVFKVLNFDFRVYERLKMFVHAEELQAQSIPDGAVTVFLRLGSDFTQNYYEYEIPLEMSDPDVVAGLNPADAEYKLEVWKPNNEFNFPLTLLRDLKQERNDQGFPLDQEYSKVVPGQQPNSREHRISVRGNPNMGFVKIAMIGLRNPYQGELPSSADGVELWVNEMRLEGLDERGGAAAIGRVDMQLADFGTLTLSGNYSSIGFGAIDQRVQERAREQTVGFDIATQLQLAKFFPDRWGINLPFYGQISKIISTPEFDPYDLDIVLKDKLRNADSREERDSIREVAQDVTTIRSFNFTDVRKLRTNNSRTPKPWDIENFGVSYAFTNTDHRDPLIESAVTRRHTASLDYTYSRPAKYIEPFKKIKSPYLKLISQFNFNPLPNTFNFSTLMDRSRTTTVYRNTGLSSLFSSFWNKRFGWDRIYDLQWDLTRSLKLNFNAVNNAVIDEPDEFDVRRRAELNPGIDPKRYIRDSIWSNIARFGRTKNYRHNFTINWNLPIRFLPFLDWTQFRALYQGEYSWTAAALNVTNLGNVIQNGQNRQLTADLRFEQIYTKSKYLRTIDRGQQGGRSSRARPPTRTPNRPDRTDDKSEAKDEGDDKKSKRSGPSTVERILLRPLLLLRNARFNFQEQFRTVLPGFLPASNILGMNPGFEAPGWDFVAGWQPRIRTLDPSEYNTSRDWLFQAQQRGWLTEDVQLNQEVYQEYTQTYDARVTLEPINDLRIDLDLSRSYTENHTQFYKNFDPNGVNFEHRIPKDFGSMTVSFSALNTLFKDSEDEIKNLFQRFEDNRLVISQRLGMGIHSDSILAEEGYTFGYGRNQQDVLIPAFLAAYTEQDPNSVKLNIFATRPRLNWTVSYDGLSKMPKLRDLFQEFRLTHGYRSTLTVNNYSTGIRYLDGVAEGNPDPVNPDNGNFFARLEIPQVVIQESFAPLVGLATTLRNGLAVNAEYRQTRGLALSLVANQMTETRSKEIIVGTSYLLRNVNLFSGGGGGSRNSSNQGRGTPQQGGAVRRGRDLELQFNFSLRDDITFNHLLDQNIVEPTRGNYQIRFSPTAEYQINRDFSVRLFFDYTRNNPKVSTGFPRTDTAGGVIVRYQLQ